MTPTQQALYDAAMLLAYKLSKGAHINAISTEAHQLIAVAVASCTTDLAGITLRAAAEARS